jgi:glycerol-3-phosphate dehydrogenase
MCSIARFSAGSKNQFEFNDNLHPCLIINFMNRDHMLSRLRDSKGPYDFIIIGGGASGVGVLLEAVTRGYSAALFEKSDFAKSTSGKSTKLVHGGVRYLAKGDVALVREACIERARLLRNAPHLVRNISFIIPSYGWFDELKYTIGLKIYDFLAGKESLGKSKIISRKKVLRRLTTIKKKQLRAGVLYHDGQFDDSRLTVNLLQTAAKQGAVLLNYMPAEGLLKDGFGKLQGVVARDSLTGESFEILGKSIINATGVFADDILQMDKPGSAPTMRPSQGIHLVIDSSFLPGNDALMIPKTSDGRVLFAVPWHGKVILGTTDTPISQPSLEPRPLEQEIEFILQNTRQYLKKSPERKDILSIFAGLRPLAAAKNDNQKKTWEISRSHKILVSDSGLLTMIGGKWTTYRKMAEDMINKAEKVNKWATTTSSTRNLKIHGWEKVYGMEDPLYAYGSDKEKLMNLVMEKPEYGEIISERLGVFKAQVIWAVREEMAITVEDFLSRRTRCQLLDARESLRMAAGVARIMAEETGKDEQWIRQQLENYEDVTSSYLPY